MKVVIAGSRSIKLTVQEVADIVSETGWDVTLVVSGGARGVDNSGEQWAEANNICISQWLPAWKEHGKAAGPIRNRMMIDHADAVIVIWDGKSRGAASTIAFARKMNKPLHEVLKAG